MIRFEHVSKRYPDGTEAVRDLELSVGEGELVTLVGPSGCGKTTTLKLVNRLVEPTSGRILLNGEDISAVDPVRLRRRIGYVIQQVGLFPHRTVLENTATVPSLLPGGSGRKARRAARERAAELLELVGLDPSVYGRRYPHQLSGGQRQRVGVARALAADPPVLLMDEPFGAVDPVVRERLQTEFLRLQAAVRKTVLFVTHDLEEAVRLGDRVAVFGNGRVEQYDTPAAVLGSPATEYVADFVGSDRDLKRLAVTPIRAGDLAQPPVVGAEDLAWQALTAIRAAGVAGAAGGTGVGGGAGAADGGGPNGQEGGWDWAVVVDGDGLPEGWVEAGTLAQAGSGVTVREYSRPVDARVDADADLKEALSVLLRHDAGWVAVLDSSGRLAGVLTPAHLHSALRAAPVSL
ncbi:ABC transporter ATP-binding protein [Phaeacidiphilus oryzae]|uniref:ABC transporter ATP-binding protein n=1 Tax=Phaeacidiphilus oryzae TaxID=348818 RepID=UPI00068FDADA|nr:ATP-binding cassette domain-containing protein [Phaeacidiphilus oryzae]